MKYHQNPPSGSRVLPCGRTDGHDEVNVASRNFENAPKNRNLHAPETAIRAVQK